MKIIMFTHLPAPYLVDFLNEIGLDIDLTVIFKQKLSAERQDEWLKFDAVNFNAVYLPKSFIKKIFCVVKFACADFNLFWNGDYSNPLSILMTFIFRIRKKEILMHADGGIVIPRVIDPLIRFVMNLSTYFASSGKGCDKYYEYYKVEKSKIFHYKFTSLFEKDMELNKNYVKEYREEIRLDMGVEKEFVIVSTGRQIYGKGYDILLNALNDFPYKVKVFIIGGQPTELNLELKLKNNLGFVEFIDFLNFNELRKYYAIADVYVLPTRSDVWGLVINEAMSFGLPIISTTKCVAACDFIDLFDNGIIVEVDNIIELRRAIIDVIEDKNKLVYFSNNSQLGIKAYTIENMVEDYKCIFAEIKRRVM